MSRALHDPQALHALTGRSPEQVMVAFETDYRSHHLQGAARIAHGSSHRTGLWAWAGHHRGEMRGHMGTGFGILTEASALNSEVRMHDIISAVQEARTRAARMGLTLILMIPTRRQAQRIPLTTWHALLPEGNDMQIYIPENGEWNHDQQ